MRNDLIIVTALAAFLLPSLSQAQDYLGSWTLDWSKVLGADITENANTDESLSSNFENSPVWLLEKDSLKVYYSGLLITQAEINWTRNDRFEIIDEEKKKYPVHYIDKMGEGRIKMHTSYSDDEIYLRKL